jgi:eukaryotic-like serine/threonine-protein kinase
MNDELRIQQLLDEIVELERTPEEVCASCPELLTEVRKHWHQMRMVEAELDAMFPTPGPNRDADTPSPWNSAAEMPRIPGYLVEAILGRGGMGIVYQARHLPLNRSVALKMLLAGAYASSHDLARFQREAEAVAGLRHTNIVQVYDAGEQEGRPYFTMEFIEGGSLAEQLSGTPQPTSEAAALVATLAQAVQVAHQGGVVHRDLKPANVLLTADGTPKITDFGLARHLEGGAGLTQTGVPVGTPSYMAPEQARGKIQAVGPAVDVYALGAILYELLTGRPPFKGETASETLLQVVSQEVVPPSRLNAKVPRDLESICLKCLHKTPERRYATAAALAEDLQRFQRGKPIVARPVGTPERLGKWVRRRPAIAALLGATVLFTIALMGGALWLTVKQSDRRHAVEGDLREVAELQQQARWKDARAVLQRAEARLNGGGTSDLRQRFNQAQRDLDLVIELDRIRLSRLTCGNLAFYKTKADRAYEQAFGDSGVANVNDHPVVVAARVRDSAVHLALTAALDDWAVCATDKVRRDWLLAVARRADPDPQGWRDRICEPASWEDSAAVIDLARTVPVSDLSVPLLLALGERLQAAGGDAPAFLKRVQSEHPADFWANLILGDALLKAAPAEAGGYYRAALASRPGEAVAYTALGDALYGQELRDQVIRYYRRAVEIDPHYARGHTNLGNFLRDEGQLNDAIACYRRALEVDPDYAWAHLDLAIALSGVGQVDEALEHYRQFHAIGPTIPHVENILRSELVRRGRGEDIRREWKKALEQDPPEHDAWFGYAELCLFLGHEEEYRHARQDLLRRFGASSDPSIAEKTARAALLMPPSDEELRTAVALTERAVAAKSTTLEWVYPYYLFVKGLAEYRQGHFDSAIATMNTKAGTVLGPCPRLVIAMAKYRLGDEQEARTILAAELSAIDWSLAEVRSHDQWLWHVLRREAEALIFPNTAAFLEGKYEPRDNIERLALLGVCRFKNRTCTSARLYADAFAADPKLADDARSSHRYHAACAAAQAGCGRGTDAEVEPMERARWRRPAREWLRADLTALVARVDTSPGAGRGDVHKALIHWREDPDLACVRDPDELDKLATYERKEYGALWTEVAAVLARTEK